MTPKQLWQQAWQMARQETWALSADELCASPIAVEAVKLFHSRRQQKRDEGLLLLDPLARLLTLKRKRLLKGS